MGKKKRGKQGQRKREVIQSERANWVRAKIKRGEKNKKKGGKEKKEGHKESETEEVMESERRKQETGK